jgi:hypothetical protein
MSRCSLIHVPEMGKLYRGTLIDLRWAKIVELRGSGFNEREADLIARLQIAEMEKLALEIGPTLALLSTVHHNIGKNRRWSSSVRYTPPPKDLWDRQFHGFED